MKVILPKVLFLFEKNIYKIHKVIAQIESYQLASYKMYSIRVKDISNIYFKDIFKKYIFLNLCNDHYLRRLLKIHNVI